MRSAASTLGLVILAAFAAAGSVYAQASYEEAKEVYEQIGKSADGMEKAKKDCVKAGKSAATGVLAWKKSRDLGINKDKWWNQADMNGLEKAEIQLLYKTSYLRFQKAIVSGGKQCYNDPRFQKALDEFKGKEE